MGNIRVNIKYINSKQGENMTKKCFLQITLILFLIALISLLTPVATFSAEKSWLGIHGNDLTDNIISNLKLPPGTKGVLVSSVRSGGPAEEAGLKVSDIIQMFDNKKIETVKGLAEIIAKTRLGGKVQIIILRQEVESSGGWHFKPLSLMVTLGKIQVKKEIFNIAIGTERMSGNTTYQIGYPVTLPNGSQFNGYFPFSKLEWPLDTWLARIDAGLNLGDSWRINGVLKKKLSDPGDKMKDSDWITASNPGRLDVYSESDISKFDASTFDIDLEWIFLKRQPWSLYAGLGYQYQKFEYDGKLIHQYSPSGLPGYDAYGDGSVAITYEITYTMPYMKIGTDIQINDKFTLDGSFAWSPIAKAEDKDHHLLVGKICTGDMNGNAYLFNLSAKYKFTSSWFLKGGFYYTQINVDGEQHQVWDNGVPIGNVKQKSDSTQTSVYLTVGYTF
jgi:outer membrane protease